MLRTAAPGSSESNQDVLVATNGAADGGIVENADKARNRTLLPGLDASLLGDEARQALQVTSTLVVYRLLALAIEELEGGEALDTKALAQLSLSIGINLGDLNLVLRVLESGSKLLVNGGKGLAVAAPGRKELDEGRLAGLEDDIVEVGGDEVEDRGLGRNGSSQTGYHQALEEDHGV